MHAPSKHHQRGAPACGAESAVCQARCAIQSACSPLPGVTVPPVGSVRGVRSLELAHRSALSSCKSDRPARAAAELPCHPCRFHQTLHTKRKHRSSQKRFATLRCIHTECVRPAEIDHFAFDRIDLGLQDLCLVHSCDPAPFQLLEPRSNLHGDGCHRGS